MKSKTKKKISVYAVFAIIFGGLGVICFIGNLVSYLSTVTYYVSQGYKLGEVLSQTLYTNFYQILQPLEMFGGVSLLLFALNTIIERLPYNKCEANVIQSFGQPVSVCGEAAADTAEFFESDKAPEESDAI